MLLRILAIVLCAVSLAFAGGADIQEHYFKEGWAGSAQAPVPAPDAPAKPAPGAPPDNPMHIDHAQVAHMFISRQAFLMYRRQFPGSELERYIGDYQGDTPPAHRDDNVVEGSFDEDNSNDNPFDQTIPEMRHFWDWNGGPDYGLAGYDSAVNRAQKYLTGGYGLDGRYDKDWSENQGKKRGVKGQGVLELYRLGHKAKAYWYLGHIAHLLEDLTVPAHVHLWPHPVPNMDRYETYMKTEHRRWGALPPGPVEDIPTLYKIFERTVQVTEKYDCGYGSGPWAGVDGTTDMGTRRMEGFTREDLDEEGDELMPLAVEKVAALYRFFFKQIDHLPPKVTLAEPIFDGRDLILRASATDEQSGVDRDSLRVQFAYRDGGKWSDWRDAAPRAGLTHVRLRPQLGRDYALRALARDAAGNAGTSEIKYFFHNSLAALTEPKAGVIIRAWAASGRSGRHSSS